MKTSQLRIRVDPTLHGAFLKACRDADMSAAQVLRAHMRDYVEKSLANRQDDLFGHTSNVSPSIGKDADS